MGHLTFAHVFATETVYMKITHCPRKKNIVNGYNHSYSYKSFFPIVINTPNHSNHTTKNHGFPFRKGLNGLVYQNGKSKRRALQTGNPNICVKTVVAIETQAGKDIIRKCREGW